MKILMVVILLVWIQRYFRSLKLSGKNPLADPGLRPPLETPPLVSVILAARNEEDNIERCLASLSSERYGNYEIIVADDRSTDNTGRIIRDKFPHVKSVKISSLPEGCSGKSHAIFQAQKQARGEWLLFTDADTIHSEQSIQTPLSYALRNRLHMLSLIPQPVTASFWEKVIQPLAGLLLFILFLPERVNKHGSKSAFGVGQYILVRRDAYDKIGGHGKLLKFPFEDIEMSRNARRNNLNYMLLYGNGVFKSRMYSSLAELWNGWERIFFLTFNNQIWVLPALTLLIALLSLLPYIAVFYYPLLGAPQLLLIHLSLERSYSFIGADRKYIFTHPLGSILLMAILWSAFFKKILKRGVAWRGKQYYEWSTRG